MMKEEQDMASHPFYQFYAELNDYEPKIWRRFQVMNDVTFARLGYILMILFEMQASHLFSIETYAYSRHLLDRFKDPEDNSSEFILEIKKLMDEKLLYEIIDDETEDFTAENETLMDATAEKIGSVLKDEGWELTFTYDFGDSWEVKLVLEKIIQDRALPGRDLPRVLAGEGYGIIEDCGGTGGLEDLAKAFKKKKGPAYKEYAQWLGMDDLDLTAFDIDDMNFRIKKIPRIYRDIYEYRLEPTEQSIQLLERKYKK